MIGQLGMYPKLAKFQVPSSKFRHHIHTASQPVHILSHLSVLYYPVYYTVWTAAGSIPISEVDSRQSQPADPAETLYHRDDALLYIAYVGP